VSLFKANYEMNFARGAAARPAGLGNPSFRLVGFGIMVFLLALPSVESNACNSSKREAAGDAEASAHRPKKAHKFLWPARGRIVTSLCAWHNEGMDLTVSDGAPVRASDAGSSLMRVTSLSDMAM
jgi:hypothetical protein